MGTAYDKAEARWNFKFPPSYRAMDKAGLFSIMKDRTYLNLTAAEWLTPDDLASFHVFHSKNRRPSFVPVATRSLGDAWCWNTEAGSGDQTPIVLCPQDADTGTHFAPD